jgi:hypothetical protein
LLRFGVVIIPSLAHVTLKFDVLGVAAAGPLAVLATVYDLSTREASSKVIAK